MTPRRHRAPRAVAGTHPCGSGLCASLGPERSALLHPRAGPGQISRGLSLLTDRPLAGGQLRLRRRLPRCPELLEEPTLPRAVPMTQETCPPSALSGARLPVLGHNPGVLCPKQDLSRGKPGHLWSACLVLRILKKPGLRPPGPHRVTEHISTLKASWEDPCGTLLNPTASPLFIPGKSSHTPRGRKAAVDSDVPRGQNLQGLEVQKRQRLPEHLVQIHPAALGWPSRLRDPSLP